MNCEKCNREISEVIMPLASKENLERIGIIPLPGVTILGFVLQAVPRSAEQIDARVMGRLIATCDNCWTPEQKSGVTQVTRATLPEIPQPKSK